MGFLGVVEFEIARPAEWNYSHNPRDGADRLAYYRSKQKRTSQERCFEEVTKRALQFLITRRLRRGRREDRDRIAADLWQRIQ